MLALASTSSIIRWPCSASEAGGSTDLRNGREKPIASKQNAKQRRINRKIFSKRLRLVTLGGEGARNINELKICFSRVVRRMRWKTIGRAIAAAPSKKNGARKLIVRLHCFRAGEICVRARSAPA